MPTPQKEWTLEEVHALPDDGNRYELVDGELLVSPSPTLLHQRVVLRLAQALAGFVETLGGHELFIAPAAVTFSRRRELQPDLFVLPLVDGVREAERFEDVGRLMLAVEVLSPSTARNDRYRKRSVYLEEGVPEYWVVDPGSRLIECWRPGDAEPEVAVDVLTWQPVRAHAALEVNLELLFGKST